MQLTTRTTLNGKSYCFKHDPCASALDVIRDQARLTGAKLVCGAGVCGACTIRVDGETVAACIMPATALAGRQVVTIEKHDRENLHPVQKAFLVHDGLQCGYCTPGFINEAIAYYERWQSEHGKGNSPTREEIACAMAGHLCRCGAYTGIFEAVRSACAGEFDDTQSFSYPRLEGIEKVTGSALYTSDIKYENQLVARLYSSPYAHAAVRSIDTSAALSLPGVKAIVDVLDDPHRVVRYIGHPILAIAAISEGVAIEALKAIKIDYDVKAFVIDADEAAIAGSPVVFPERKKNPANASEGPIPPANWQGNVRIPILNKAMSRKQGQARKAIVAARSGEQGMMLVNHEFNTPSQTHTAFEPHGCVAVWDGDDRLTVHASSQSVFVLANEIASQFKLKRENVQVLSEFTGGAFGAKAGMKLEHTATIALARKACAPVGLTFDRQEEMTIGGYRPATQVEFTLATDEKHAQRGMSCEARGSSGIAVQSQVAPWVKYTYKGPKYCLDIDITTNAGPAKPMRGPSGPPAFWALESSVDQLAHQLQVDPITLRRQWEGSDVRDALYDWVESIPEWRERHRAGAGKGRIKSGIGFAIGNWFNAFHNATRVKIHTSPEGLVAECAVQDMGQGSRSVIGKAVADELGVSAHAIRLDIGRANYVEGPISSASRTTASIFPVSVEAARMLKDRLLGLVNEHLELANPHWKDGGVGHDGGYLPLSELLTLLPPTSVTSNKRGGNGNFDLLGRLPSGDVGLSMLFRMTGAVSLVAVDVDTRLGRVHPSKIWMGMSVGKIVNPALANSQIYGAVVQSLGFALTEERRYDPLTGSLLSIGLEDYRIPGMGEIPEIDIHYDESRFSKMRGGACGLSEISTLALAPALGNAVFNATGWRPTDLPLTPQRVIQHV